MESQVAALRVLARLLARGDHELMAEFTRLHGEKVRPCYVRINIKIYVCMYVCMYVCIHRARQSETDRQTGRQAGRQTDRQR